MNSRQKEVTKAQLNSEEKTLKELKQVYSQALKDCQRKIMELSERTDMENLQSIIYQKHYQEALKAQLEGVMEKLHSNSYATVSDYLNQCYQDGYIGVMYDIQGQGIPIIVPIDQKAVTRAIQTDSKLSTGLYSRLGEDVKSLKTSVRAELSRGISAGYTWNEIAGKIAKSFKTTPFSKAYNNAMRIARTEGHRIAMQSAMDAQRVAKSKGADIKKQWDATLDDRTRDTHRLLDGQIREVDEMFEVSGRKVEAPGMFGDPSEDCNCRCTVNQRAAWALDEDELRTLQERAEFFGLDKSKEFAEYRQKYLNLPENADTVNLKEYDLLSNTQKLKAAMSESDYDAYMNILKNHENESLQKLYAEYADKINAVKYKKDDGHYSSASNELVFSYELQKYIDAGRNKYNVIAHEYGHFFDAKAKFNGLNFREVETIHSKTKYQTIRFAKVASSSDEFLSAVRKDRQLLQSVFTTDVEKDLKDHHASCGVQDAIDGLLSHRIAWGHGDRYYNRKYSSVKKLNEQKQLQEAYKELGIAASNQSKVARECRVYEAASEMWANIMSAEINGGEELEYIKKYLPNSYEAMLQILKGVE